MTLDGDAHSLERLVATRDVIICAGTGGVGKTTISAALALAGARLGRRAIVVTIDPAKRLANALGLDSLTNSPSEIEPARWIDGTDRHRGHLWALMLDSKSTFDDVVAREAGSAEQAERIFANRFYRNLTSALSGTQEYMAAEKLHQLHTERRFELIVVDTPPTRHALDFLDAPQRLLRLLSNPMFRTLMAPTRLGMRAAGVALTGVLRAISRVVGAEVIDDAVAFFRAFEGMEEGFRTRAMAVQELIADPATAFVVVTSPRQDSLDEARWFGERLRASELRVAAAVVNRVHPSFAAGTPLADASARLELVTAAEPGSSLAGAAANLIDFERLAVRERTHVDALVASSAADAIVLVPMLSRDVHDLDSLGEVSRYLVGGDGSAGVAETGGLGRGR